MKVSLKQKIELGIWRIFLVWYAIGIILVSLDWLPSSLLWANAVFLYLAGILAAIFSMKVFGNQRGLLFSIIIILATISAESLGVHYGLIFGEYHYEKDFGIQLFGVPITIGFAWLLVIFTSMAFFIHLLEKKRSLTKGFCYVVLTSLLAVAMDLIIDPVAFKAKQYWIWDQPGFYYDIPNQNFLGWFMVSCTIQMVLYLVATSKKFQEFEPWSKKMRLLYVLVLTMFIATALFEQLYLAVFVTLAFFVAIAGYSYYWRNRYDFTEKE